jgi:hypothetical protein
MAVSSERRQRDGDRDDPWVDRVPFGVGVRDGNGCDRRAHVPEGLPFQPYATRDRSVSSKHMV